MNFIVLTSMSAPNKLSSLYFSQLEKAGIPYYVRPNKMTSPNEGTLRNCLKWWRQWAEEYPSYDRLIMTDAWDVLCYGSREQIERNLANLPDTVVFAAERNCYPEPGMADQIPSFPTPWRFANGGMLTASPKGVISWCAAAERHPAYDPEMIGQGWLNRRLAEGDPLALIDRLTSLFYCMYGEQGELINRDGGPYNTAWETHPSFIHFNGAWDWNPFLEMMNA